MYLEAMGIMSMGLRIISISLQGGSLRQGKYGIIRKGAVKILR